MAWLSLALALPRGPEPRGEEAGSLLAGASLAEDGDLRFAAADRERGYRLWPGGPARLRLGVTPAAGEGEDSFAFVEGWLAPLLVAAVWPVAGGASGALVGSACAVLIAWALRRGTASPSPPAPAGGFGLHGLLAAASILPFWALRGEPILLPAALASMGAVIWRRPGGGDPSGGPGPRRSWRAAARLGGSGSLLGLAAGLEPGLGVVAALAAAQALGPVVAPSPRGGEAKPPAGGFAAWILVSGFLLGLGLHAAGQHAATSTWTRPTSAVRVFGAGFPGEIHRAAEGQPLETPRRAGRAEWPREARDLLVGRPGGLALLAPGFLAAIGLGWLAALGRRDSGGGGDPRAAGLPAPLQIAGFVALAGLAVLWPGPASRAGLVAGLPAWILVTGPTLPRLGIAGRLAPIARGLLAGLFVAWSAVAAWQAGLASLAGDSREGLATVPAPLARLLPLELAAVPQRPGYVIAGRGDALWALPTATAFADERHAEGVWLRGASRSEIVLISPRELQSVTLRLSALAPSARVELRSSVAERWVAFDSEAKRAGVVVDLPLPPRGDDRDRGRYFPAGERYYLVTVEVSDGVVPRRSVRRSSDARNLGVFLGLPE